MATEELLIEQHEEYTSRLKHIDELLERARKGVATASDTAEMDAELAALRQERDKLQHHIEEIKQQSREEWQVEGIEDVGPMVLWDAVAKKLEGLIERIERK